MCVNLADDVDALQAATRNVKKRRTGPARLPITMHVYDHKIIILWLADVTVTYARAHVTCLGRARALNKNPNFTAGILQQDDETRRGYRAVKGSPRI